MENNFEDHRKETFENIDVDANILQRKKLELDEKYIERRNTETDFYLRELEIANNNDDEMLRRTKVKDVCNDHAAMTAKLYEDYANDLKEIQEKYEPKYNKPYYFKWIYTGPVNKYSGVVNGLSYFIKLDEYDNIEIFGDVKLSKFITKIKYLTEEWREAVSFIGNNK